MKNRIFPAFLFIIFLVVFIIFYKGLQNSNVYIPDISIEKEIPIFNARSFSSNKKISSEEIFKKNKFYLLNIWASWCVPCRDEHPYLMNLGNQKNLEIIGLNYKDDKIKAKNFLKKFNNPYKFIFLDKDGTIAIDWGAYVFQETFLIYNNKIIKKIIGPLNEVSLSEIKNLIR